MEEFRPQDISLGDEILFLFERTKMKGAEDHEQDEKETLEGICIAFMWNRSFKYGGLDLFDRS
jgi:hypothetical protein